MILPPAVHLGKLSINIRTSHAPQQDTCAYAFSQLVYVRVCSRMCMNEQDTHVMTQLVYVRVCLRMCMNVLLDCCLGGARNNSTLRSFLVRRVGQNCCAHLPCRAKRKVRNWIRIAKDHEQQRADTNKCIRQVTRR